MPHFFIKCFNNRSVMRIDLFLCCFAASSVSLQTSTPQPLAHACANLVFLSLMKEAFQEQIENFRKALRSEHGIIPKVLNMNIFDFYQNLFHRLRQCDQIPSFLILHYFADVLISISSRKVYRSHAQFFDKGRYCHMHYDLNAHHFQRSPICNDDLLSIGEESDLEPWPCSKSHELYLCTIIAHWCLIEEKNPYTDVPIKLRCFRFEQCPCLSLSKKYCKIAAVSVLGRDLGVFYCQLIFLSALASPINRPPQKYPPIIICRRSPRLLKT